MDNVKKGDRVISAEALNDGIKGGRLSTSTRVSGGHQSQFPGAGQIIDVTQREKRKAVGVRTVRQVVVKKSPSTTAGWITVQEVQYIDWPVQPCTDSGCRIQVFGPEIEVRPYFGKKDNAYASYEVTTTIDSSTTFFDIKWDGRIWMIDPPPVAGTSASIVLVHGPGVGTNWAVEFDFIRVIHMVKNPAYVLGNGQPTHIWGGVAVDALGYSIVQCWPGTKQVDWQPFLSTNSGFPPTIPPGTFPVYFTTKLIGGVEYITPEVFAEAGAPDSGTLAGDC